MAKVERIPSGIPGLDELMEGGFVKGSTILVSGNAGAGKTIFSLQFLWEGLKRGEKCLYVTLEELPEEILEDAKVFGWDFEKYLKEGMFFIEYADPFELTDIVELLVEKIRKNNIQRVVIDSTSILGLYFDRPSEVRRQLYKLVKSLKQTGATAVLTAEIEDQHGFKVSRYGVEEFVVDAVIVIHFLEISVGVSRSIQIRKMRRTKHSTNLHPLKITENGLVVLSKEQDNIANLLEEK
jgi:KaiC/GvpD/RAD55 family RecA-like ATPase